MNWKVHPHCLTHNNRDTRGPRARALGGPTIQSGSNPLAAQAHASYYFDCYFRAPVLTDALATHTHTFKCSNAQTHTLTNLPGLPPVPLLCGPGGDGGEQRAWLPSGLFEMCEHVEMIHSFMHV
jgi:hypothetical protein